MRQEIACLIHDVDGHFAIGNANVDMQSKNQIRAREQLHVFYDFLVAIALGDKLIVPMRKRVGTHRCDF